MRISPDEALENFKKLMETEWLKLSEADTRSKIIDPVFTKCLNWNEKDFFREEHGDTGYVDYVFKIGKKNVFVVEAKKNGVSFKLPITVSFRKTYHVGGILATSPDIKKAMRQARRYCNDKGARFGVISNGEQYIIFEAIKLGEDWEKGNVRIFYNVDYIQRNFMDFWNLLSKDAVERGSLVENLSKEVEEHIFARAVDGIHFKNEQQPRNNLSRYMRDVINFAFKDITQDMEILDNCYVLETEFKDLDRILKNEVSRSLKTKSEFKEIVQGEETAGIFLADFYKVAELMAKAPPEPLMLLVLGKIGSGKTTFIHRFFNVVLDEGDRKKIKWFYINFKDAPTETKEIRGFILKNILRQFILNHRDLFDQISEKMKMKEISPTVEDISKLFLILKYENFIPSLIIDNVDQHKSDSPKFHGKVFLEANSLTKELRTITIITLREESYYASKKYGVFDAYNLEAYQINPPSFRKMLLARLNYSIAELHSSGSTLQKTLSSHLEYEQHSDDVIDFLEIVRDTIRRSYKRSASRFISSTSGGDMRRALELFERFLVSGNTKVNEILDVKKKYGSYTIAEHQFVKSIVLNNLRYYSQEPSYLMNLFDFNTQILSSHFLKLRILEYAEELLGNDSIYGKGFVSINQLRKDARDIGISPEAVGDALIKMAEYGLILLNTRSRKNLDHASHFILTDCGNYYLNVLIKRFSYIDLVLPDTPIADVDLVKEFRILIPEKRIHIRFERTKKFLEYLQKMEKREHELNPEYRFSPLCKHMFTSSMLSSFESEKRYILRKYKEKAMEYL